jgi:hypothetical protein
MKTFLLAVLCVLVFFGVAMAVEEGYIYSTTSYTSSSSSDSWALSVPTVLLGLLALLNM